MIVCLCQGVSETKVRAAIDAGAQTRREVTAACRAGAGCGGCHPTIRNLIRERRAQATCPNPARSCPSEDFVALESY